MTEAARPPSSSSGSAYAWYVAAVLCLTNTISYLDRQAIVLLIEPIKQDLQIGDAAFGLLQGLSFALLYALLGLPLGAIADRGSRVMLIRAGAAVWSVMTAACGLATGFWSLFLARVGVGAGEATLTPAATSMIADYFPGPDRPKAMSLFVMGASLGSGLALVAGGQIVAALPRVMTLPGLGSFANWQMTFVICGLIGLVSAALMWTVREPARRVSSLDGAVGTETALLAFLRHRGRLIASIILGFSLLGLVSFGVGSWMPVLLMRRFDLNAGEIGWIYGLVVLAAAPLGVLSGGFLGSHFARGRTPGGPLLAAILGGIGLVFCALLPALSPNLALALGAAFLFNFAAPFPFGLAYAVLVDLTPTALRARVVAIYGLTLSLVGYGLGPAAIGALSEVMADQANSVGRGMIILAIVVSPVALLMLAGALRVIRRGPRTHGS